MKREENEKFYDDHIAPELLRLRNLCADRDMGFVAQVEFFPGAFGLTAKLYDASSLPMRWAYLAMRCKENVDALIIGIKRDCIERGIDTGASIFLSRFGGGQ